MHVQGLGRALGRSERACREQCSLSNELQESINEHGTPRISAIRGILGEAVAAEATSDPFLLAMPADVENQHAGPWNQQHNTMAHTETSHGGCLAAGSALLLLSAMNTAFLS